jgi:hypothetical protein
MLNKFMAKALDLLLLSPGMRLFVLGPGPFLIVLVVPVVCLARGRHISGWGKCDLSVSGVVFLVVFLEFVSDGDQSFLN